MYRAGIVGLPNVGKSTLFNSLIKNYQAEAANYPFCTIEPNTGIVTLPDERLGKLLDLIKAEKVVPAVFEFVDIAGLVKGASKGEGLGNKFLNHIREVDAIVHVVRCFDDSDIVHVEEKVDPLRDIEIINLELALCDLQSIEKKIESVSKKQKGNEKESKIQLELLNKMLKELSETGHINSSAFVDEDLVFFKSLFLLSDKPVIYAANVSEEDIKNPTANAYFMKVKEHAEKTGAKCVAISAKIEAELISFTKEERAEILGQNGSKNVPYSGVDDLIKATFDLLGLSTYFTAGVKEVRAWTILKNTKAPQAAGVIHTDFEKGFIKAEVIKYDDLMRLGSKVSARESGVARLEGKEYVVQDSDVIEFKFNV